MNLQDQSTRRHLIIGCSAGLVTTAVFGWFRSAAAQISCPAGNAWAIANPSAPDSAPPFPASITTPPGQLGYLMLYDKNPYHKQTNSDIFYVLEWPFSAQKDLGPTQWQFRGKNVPIQRSLRVPYRIQDADGKCSSEALLIGMSVRRKRIMTPITWGTPPGSLGNGPEDLGWLVATNLLFMRTATGGALGSSQGQPNTGNWYDRNNIDRDQSPSVWTFREQRLRADESFRIAYCVYDGQGWRDTDLYVGYEGGGAY